MDGLVVLLMVCPLSMVFRRGSVVLSLANLVWPSSAHVMAFSIHSSSSCLACALARLAATRRSALARNLLANGPVGVGFGSGFDWLVSFSGGSAAKAGNVA